jgi:NADH-quinone oxidoreductase subunit M
VGVAYTLRAMQKAFYSDAEPAGHGGHHDHRLEPISMPEKVAAVLLLGTSLVIGLYPNFLMNWIEPCFRSPLFARLINGGAQ